MCSWSTCLFVSLSTWLGLPGSSQAYIWFRKGGSYDKTSISSLYIRKRSLRSSKNLLFNASSFSCMMVITNCRVVACSTLLATLRTLLKRVLNLAFFNLPLLAGIIFSNFYSETTVLFRTFATPRAKSIQTTITHCLHLDILSMPNHCTLC